MWRFTIACFLLVASCPPDAHASGDGPAVRDGRSSTPPPSASAPPESFSGAVEKAIKKGFDHLPPDYSVRVVPPSNPSQPAQLVVRKVSAESNPEVWMNVQISLNCDGTQVVDVSPVSPRKAFEANQPDGERTIRVWPSQAKPGWNTGDHGCFFSILARIDPQNLILETSEDNNLASALYTPPQ